MSLVFQATTWYFYWATKRDNPSFRITFTNTPPPPHTHTHTQHTHTLTLIFITFHILSSFQETQQLNIHQCYNDIGAHNLSRFNKTGMSLHPFMEMLALILKYDTPTSWTLLEQWYFLIILTHITRISLFSRSLTLGFFGFSTFFPDLSGLRIEMWILYRNTISKGTAIWDLCISWIH